MYDETQTIAGLEIEICMVYTIVNYIYIPHRDIT
jgi:hypothetical protein